MLTSAKDKIPSSSRWLIAAVSAIVDDRTLRWNEKLLLLALARNCNGFGVCWPSRKRLSADTGMSLGSVQRAIRGAELKGWLRRSARFDDESNGSNTNLYQVIVGGGS